MATIMYNLFARHHIRPGEFWNMPKGEQLLLTAFSDFEIEDEITAHKKAKARREAGKKNGR